MKLLGKPGKIYTMANISSHLRNEILNLHRSGETISYIADKLGFKIKEVEAVIYPNGRDIRPLPVVVSRRIDPSKRKQVDERQKKLINAGRKSWETRRRNAEMPEKNQEEIPPPMLDQPIVQEIEQLETMKKEEKEEIIHLLEEGLEYIKVGMENFAKAIELLKK